MKRSSGSRKTASNLSESVHQQINKYALAASAAGVGMLALAQSAEAKIIYTHANVHIGINRHYNLDLNHDGIVDFTIGNGLNGNGKCSTFAGVGVGPTAKRVNGVVAGRGLWQHYPFALSQGVKIGAGGNSWWGWGGGGAMAKYNHYRNSQGVCTNFSIGRWINATDRYLGLKFGIHGKTHYGWARLTVHRSGRSFVAHLTGYAYENITGKSILAGQTHGTANQSDEESFGAGTSVMRPIDPPQPASLGTLALGAQGVPLWRRKESVGCVSENN
jgi:hypothetical protein